MNTEQLARLLTALEAIAVGTARIAAALETSHETRQHVRVTVTPTGSATPLTDLNPKGPYA